MVMMNHPNFERKFYLQTDASNIALGAELYQEDDEKEHHTIAIASRTLLAAERNILQQKRSCSVSVSYTHLQESRIDR